MFLISEETLTLIVLGICIIPIVLLMVYAIYVALRNGSRRGQEREKEILSSQDFSQIELFVGVYGGKDNIIEVTRELSRINVRVEDIEKVRVDELKELGANGVLLVNDIVKCSFGDRAPYIFRLLNNQEDENE